MAYDQVFPTDSTSKLIEVMVRDSTTGMGKTGLAYGSVTFAYWREGAASGVNDTCVDMTLGVWTTKGWKEVDSTNQKGVYQFGIPDAALATGVDAVTINFQASGMIDKAVRVLLSSPTRGLASPTALPAVAAGANGGLPLGDASGRVDLGKILGTALTETSGQIAARVKDFFDQASATFSIATALSSFKATGFSTHSANDVKTAFGTGSALTEVGLSSTALAAVVAAIEAEIADDETGEAVKQAIIDKLIENIPNLDDLTLAAIANAVWGAATAGLQENGTFGKTLHGNIPQTGDSFARLGAPAGESVSADVAAVKSETAAILVDTGTSLPGLIITTAGSTVAHGDSAWGTATGFSTLDAEGIRTAIGMASANLDDQLDTILGAGGGDATAENQTTILAAIAELSALTGEGAYTGVLTIDDGDGTVLEGAVVSARRGGVLKASGTTDDSGEITTWVFGAYTYDLAVRLAGY